MREIEHPPNLARVIQVIEAIPQCLELGIKVVELRHGHGVMHLPYDDRLIGNPATGVVHGGVITTFLDTACGMVVMSAVPDHTSVATLDLRIDYLRPAVPRLDILASAECYSVTESVAFVRGLAYQLSFRHPIANCAGTFMLGHTGFTVEGALARTETG